MLNVTHIVRQSVDVNLSPTLRKHSTAVINHDCRTSFEALLLLTVDGSWVPVIFKMCPGQYDVLFKPNEAHFASFLAQFIPCRQCYDHVVDLDSKSKIHQRIWAAHTKKYVCSFKPAQLGLHFVGVGVIELWLQSLDKYAQPWNIGYPACYTLNHWIIQAR